MEAKIGQKMFTKLLQLLGSPKMKTLLPLPLFLLIFCLCSTAGIDATTFSLVLLIFRSRSKRNKKQIEFSQIYQKRHFSILFLFIMETATNENGFMFSDGEWISLSEFSIRRNISFAFRLVLGTFCSAQLWDFLFNPIWMHGYLWSLNQPHSLADNSGGNSLADKSAAAILEHQLNLVRQFERIGHALFSTLASWLLLHCANFGHSNQTVWHLLRISLCSGAVAGLSRSIQQHHRLYSCIHECFYVFLLLFINGLCLCLRMPSKSNTEGNKSKND